MKEEIKRPFDLSPIPQGDQPAPLLIDLIEYGGMPKFREWLKTFDFKSIDELTEAVRLVVVTATSDRHLNIKGNRDNDPIKKYIFNQFNSIMNRADALDKYAVSVGGELWGGYFARYKLDTRTKAIFSQEPNHEDWKKSAEKIKSIWGFNDLDIEKFRFFVCMVKDKEFPPTLRRLLYLWGEKNQTGKTTIASSIISILNGEDSIENISKYSSSLAVEMQVQNYAVPKISECNAVMMDEMFYADMTKSYNPFKAFITSENGSARLPYGQTFAWYGKPNYFATSNYPLTQFIKDQQDRRYLEIRIETVPKQASFEEIFELWRTFCVNATMPEKHKSWKEWNDAIMSDAEVKGEKFHINNDYQIHLQSSDFRKLLEAKEAANTGLSASHNDNRITVLYISNFLRDLGVDVRKERMWIEKAAEAVFGLRRNNQYWLVGEMLDTLRNSPDGQEAVIVIKEEDLPF